jgi:chemotaxis protein MotB
VALDQKTQPIIIKRRAGHAHGHHGGAWKIAYADFVTAMMAFFLLMWLLSMTTFEDKLAIADFFQNPSAIQGPGGASTSMIKMGGSQEIPRGEGEALKGQQEPGQAGAATPPTTEEAEQLAADLQEQARLDALMRELMRQIEATPSLRAYKDQLMLDITSEGLRIQIVDRDNRPMFDLGSTELRPYTREILLQLAKTIKTAPNHVSIAGHTDALPFSGGRPNYTNWELSADRANSARRELMRGGLSDEMVGRVVGLASSVLARPEDPLHPTNRRISIIIMNRATEKAIGLPPLIPRLGSDRQGEESTPPGSAAAPPAGAAVLPSAAAVPSVRPAATAVSTPDSQPLSPPTVGGVGDLSLPPAALPALPSLLPNAAVRSPATPPPTTVTPLEPIEEALQRALRGD